MASISRARASRSERATPRFSRPKVTLSRTVRHGRSACSWNTIAVSGVPGRSAWMRTSPALWRCRPASTRSSVDLPLPLGPTMQRNSPAWAWSEIRSSATTERPRLSKVTLTSFTRTLGSRVGRIISLPTGGSIVDKPLNVFAVVASQPGGNTDRLVGRVLEAASDGRTAVTSAAVHLGAGPLDATRVESPMQSLAAADAVVLKEFLERVPRGGPPERFDGPLRAKAVGIVATGGSHHHFLGADPLIGILVRYFGAYVVPPVLYGVIRTGTDPDPALLEDAARFGRALVALCGAIRNDDRLREARAQI